MPSTRARTQGVGTLSLTYEGVLESDASHQDPRSFLWDCTFPKGEAELTSLTATTTVQDRRTDRSLAAIVPDFGNLSSDVGEALLRYPGSCADWRSCGVIA
jgi:glutaminase